MKAQIFFRNHFVLPWPIKRVPITMPFFLKSNVNMGSTRLLFLELQGCLICPYLETLFNLFVYFSFRKSTIRRITADAPCQGVCKCIFFYIMPFDEIFEPSFMFYLWSTLNPVVHIVSFAEHSHLVQQCLVHRIQVCSLTQWYWSLVHQWVANQQKSGKAKVFARLNLGL